jgi:hypothetical protein
MQAEFLNSKEFNKKNILENVLAPNGNDGQRAIKDISALVHEERVRQTSKKFLWVATAGQLFTIYNVSRLGQLSPTGRPAAIAGLLFFTFWQYSCASRA